MIKIEKLTKTYNKGKENEFTALKNVDLTISDGESVAIIGKSGAGKSTLLHMLAGIDKASDGKVIVDDADIMQFNDKAQAEYRNKTIGIVMQEFFLIKNASVLDNIVLPLNFVKMKNNKRIARATELIYGVSMEANLKKAVFNLSGGEKQRVAIARALVNDPKYIYADEPTGSLDSENGEAIIEMLLRINAKGKTLIIITHDMEIASRCRRVIELKDGEVIRDYINESVAKSTALVSEECATDENIIKQETFPIDIETTETNPSDKI